MKLQTKTHSIATTRGKTTTACESLANQEQRKQLDEPIGTQGQCLARENECERVKWFGYCL